MTSHASFVNVSYPIASVELTQLEKYKNYDIWMAAFTVKGVGLQNSSVVQQMTDEDSKFVFSTRELTTKYQLRNIYQEM